MGPNCWNFLENFLSGRDCPENCCGLLCGIYELNSMLVGMRPGIAMEIGFKNWNRCRMSGLPVDSPLPLFWDCKNSPGFV